MGFSIGGWHPFSGGLIGDLTGGTINGQTVFSGGLAGLAEHLDEIAQGVNASLLGGTVGGALNSLVSALDAPVINATKWVDAHKTAVIAVVAMVGIAILAPYAFAAWEVAADEAEVDAAIDLEVAGDLTEDVAAAAEADAVGDVTAEAAAAASTADADAAAAAEVDAVGDVSTEADAAANAADTEAAQASGAADQEASNAAGMGTGTDQATPVGSTVGTSATTGTSATGAGSSLGSKLGSKAVDVAESTILGSLLGTVVKDITGKKTVSTLPVITLKTSSSSSSIPTWAYMAGAAALILILVKK